MSRKRFSGPKPKQPELSDEDIATETQEEAPEAEHAEGEEEAEPAAR